LLEKDSEKDDAEGLRNQSKSTKRGKYALVKTGLQGLGLYRDQTLYSLSTAPRDDMDAMRAARREELKDEQEDWRAVDKCCYAVYSCFVNTHKVTPVVVLNQLTLPDLGEWSTKGRWGKTSFISAADQKIQTRAILERVLRAQKKGAKCVVIPVSLKAFDSAKAQRLAFDIANKKGRGDAKDAPGSPGCLSRWWCWLTCRGGSSRSQEESVKALHKFFFLGARHSLAYQFVHMFGYTSSSDLESKIAVPVLFALVNDDPNSADRSIGSALSLEYLKRTESYPEQKDDTASARHEPWGRFRARELKVRVHTLRCSGPPLSRLASMCTLPGAVPRGGKLAKTGRWAPVLRAAASFGHILQPVLWFADIARCVCTGTKHT